jgi:hypothetical protein
MTVCGALMAKAVGRGTAKGQGMYTYWFLSHVFFSPGLSNVLFFI